MKVQIVVHEYKSHRFPANILSAVEDKDKDSYDSLYLRIAKLGKDGILAQRKKGAYDDNLEFSLVFRDNKIRIR